MRRVIGWLLVLLGTLAALAGIAVAVLFGTDDTVTTGPHRLTTAGSAIVTAPSALPLAGPTLLLTATSPVLKSRLFLGVAADRHVRAYLARTSYTRINSVSLPWSVGAAHVLAESTRHRGTVSNPERKPWWLIRTISVPGADSVSAIVPLPSYPVDLVLMDLRHLHGFPVRVTVGLEQPGIFLAAVAAALGGVGLAVVGWWLLRRPTADRR